MSAKADRYAANANLWRISGDFWDQWPALRRSFALLDRWSPHVKPGAWPDADMLPLGRIGIRAERGDDRQTRFTKDEQRTLITLWSIARSPLMFGGDLPSNDDWTLSLLDNDEVLAADQHGANSHQLFARENQVAWVSDAPGGGKFLAVFNTGEQPAEIRVDWKDLGLAGKPEVRDLWEKKALGSFDGGRSFPVAPHGAGMYRVK